MVCDTLGRPLRFMLTAGQRHDNLTAKDLLEGFQAEAVLADKAYDNNDLRQTIAEMKALVGLREPDASIEEGLDLAVHGERAYPT